MKGFALVFACICLQLTGCAWSPNSSRIVDADKDGVADSLDRCPESQPQALVDEKGCALFSGTIKNVDFAPGDHRLNAESRKALGELVDALQQYPQVVLALGGHTDNRGPAADNLALSKQRVMAVVKYLVINGIPAERLQPFGYGESQPMMSNQTEEGRTLNRRIEMSIVAQ